MRKKRLLRCIITEVQDYEREGEMLHDQNDDWLTAPTAPNLVPRVRIYVQALGVLWHVDGAERQERDTLREDYRNHRWQKLAAIAP